MKHDKSQLAPITAILECVASLFLVWQQVCGDPPEAKMRCEAKLAIFISRRRSLRDKFILDARSIPILVLERIRLLQAVNGAGTL